MLPASQFSPKYPPGIGRRIKWLAAYLFRQLCASRHLTHSNRIIIFWQEFLLANSPTYATLPQLRTSAAKKSLGRPPSPKSRKPPNRKSSLSSVTCSRARTNSKIEKRQRRGERFCEASGARCGLPETDGRSKPRPYGETLGFSSSVDHRAGFSWM